MRLGSIRSSQSTGGRGLRAAGPWLAGLLCLTVGGWAAEPARAEPPAATTPDSTPAGFLHVITEPAGAMAYLDGVSHGLTPTKIPVRTAGPHSLLLSREGYGDRVRVVTLLTGQQLTLRERLVRLTGELAVESTPPGAAVEVAGQARGRTPLLLRGLLVGTHPVRLTLPLHQPWMTSIRIEAGSRARISARLQGEPARVIFSSIPKQARITLDGEPRGQTVLPLLLAPGLHTVRYDLDGYLSHEEEFTLRPGELRAFTPVLVRDSAVVVESSPEIMEAAEAGGDLSRYEITLFTPDKRDLSRQDQRLLDTLERIGFRIDRSVNLSNPDANIKIARGRAALARSILKVIERFYRGPFEIKEIFDPHETDIFINLGEAQPIQESNVVLFTPQSRPFTLEDQALIAALRASGFQVQEAPGSGGSNDEPNIKLAQGRGEQGEKLRRLLQRCYDQPFAILELFDEDDPDIFINLGTSAKPQPDCTDRLQSKEDLDFSPFFVIVFTPAGRPFSVAERNFIRQLKHQGFRVQEEPGGGPSTPDANLKVTRGQTAVAEHIRSLLGQCYEQPFEIKDIFEPGAYDIYINLGRDEDARLRCDFGEDLRPEPAADGYGQYRIRFFSPLARPLNTAEEQLSAQLRELGFQVEAEPLPSNLSQQIQVGRDRAMVGELVRRITAQFTGQRFRLRPSFESGDTDIFIYLGPEARGSLAPPDPAQASGFRAIIFTPDGRPLNASDQTILMQLRGLGIQVEDTRPGGGGSNVQPNIKVCRGCAALGERVREIVQRCYDQEFELLEVFPAETRDIFINLGQDADRRTKCGKTRL